jgi:hypothetical protein
VTVTVFGMLKSAASKTSEVTSGFPSEAFDEDIVTGAVGCVASLTVNVTAPPFSVVWLFGEGAETSTAATSSSLFTRETSGGSSPAYFGSALDAAPRTTS